MTVKRFPAQCHVAFGIEIHIGEGRMAEKVLILYMSGPVVFREGAGWKSATYNLCLATAEYFIEETQEGTFLMWVVLLFTALSTSNLMFS